MRSSTAFPRQWPVSLRTPGPAGRVRIAGFTLVELLVACAVTSILLMVATGMTVQAKRANALTSELVEKGQIVELASEILRYHLSLAGHGGLDPHAPELAGPDLELARGAGQAGTDVLTVRYVEERWYARPTARTVHFDVRRDGSGVWNLYLREAGATRQPAVREVDTLQVRALLAPDGEVVAADSPLPLTVGGLELELGFTWDESRRLLITFGRPVTLTEADAT